MRVQEDGREGLRVKWFYVGISTLLVTLAISAVSAVGLQRFLAGHYNQALDLTWKIGLGVFACLNLAWLFYYLFSSENLQEAMFDWVSDICEFYRCNWRKLVAIVLTVAVGVCFVVGAGHLVMEAYKSFVIAKDAEQFIASKLNPLQEKLATVESQVRMKEVKIADLEAKVKALTEENVKLRETVKKAARF